MNKAQKAAARLKSFKKAGFTAAEQKDLDKFEKEKEANKAKTKALINTVVENYLVAHPEAAEHKANVVKKIEDEQTYLHPKAFAERYAAYMPTVQKSTKSRNTTMKSKFIPKRIDTKEVGILSRSQADFCLDMIRSAILNQCAFLDLAVGPNKIQLGWHDMDDSVEIQADENLTSDYEQFTLAGFAKAYDLTFKRPTKTQINATIKRNKYMDKLAIKSAERLEKDKETVSKSHAAVEKAQLKTALQHKADGTPLFSFEKKLIADAKKAEKNNNKKLDKSGEAKLVKRNAAARAAYLNKKDKGLAKAKAAHKETMQTLANLRNKKKANKANQESDVLGFN